MSNYFNYFTEIEETFVRRRGKSLLLSPLDWALMESWKERDIPLHIVLRAIEHVFDVHDAQPNRKRTVKSLAYCKEEVEAQFAEWAEMRAGEGSDAEAGPTGTVGSTSAHVASSMEKVRELIESETGALKEALERALARLEVLVPAEESAEKLEASLSGIDDLLDEAIIQQADSADIEAVEKQMASYRESMDRESFDRTFRLMLLKRLRESSPIPRFSLFYL